MSTAPFRLSIGDRAPNFSLPRPDGKLLAFYEETRGKPILLVFCRDPAGGALDALVGHQVPLADDAHVFAICAAAPAVVATIADRLQPKFPLLADGNGRVTDAFLGASQATGDDVAIVLDPNQRVLASFDPRRQPDWPAAAAAILRPTGPGEPREHRELAPVLIVPRMLEPDQCRRLIDIWTTGGHEEGAVLSTRDGAAADVLNYASKKRLDHKVKDPALTKELTFTLGPRIATEAFRAFHFQDFRLEPFFIVRYDAERRDFFRPHRDNLIPELALRRFALTVNLNDDYDGGGLRFPEYGPHFYRPPAGGGILFSCSLLHEATPVSAGQRFALLTFLRAREAAPGAAAKA